jgi:Phytanoyl-CoA dioxygenase (PhyH)
VSVSGSDVARFSAFGFVVLRNVLSEETCRSIAREFAEAFQIAYQNLASRTTPAWLPGLGDATPCSAALVADDSGLWQLSKRLLGGDSLPFPPEVGLLHGSTPWHYDDPLGLRGVKFLTYVIGPASGLRVLPMSHTPPQREFVKELLTNAGSTDLDAVPSVPITVAPGDVVAIDLHLWHCYRSRERRLLWAPEYLAWPVEPAETPNLDRKFESVATAGEIDGGGTSWPVWREWLRTSRADDARRAAADLLRRAGAFRAGRDQC